jgi:hypothetical protein
MSRLVRTKDMADAVCQLAAKIRIAHFGAKDEGKDATKPPITLVNPHSFFGAIEGTNMETQAAIEHAMSDLEFILNELEP